LIVEFLPFVHEVSSLTYINNIHRLSAANLA